MEFLIFSDLHGRRRNTAAMWERRIHAPDAVLFLGDGLRDLCAEDFLPSVLFCVAGNCDWSPRLGDGTPVSRMELLQFEGHRLLLTHGDAFGVKSGTGALLAAAAREGADIVLYGHTHLPRLERVPAGETVAGIPLARDLYLFNPGSLGEGSFGTLTLREGTVLFSHGTV